nr:MAG TPA: hypothetical protein [Bacteriophage sp.]
MFLEINHRLQLYLEILIQTINIITIKLVPALLKNKIKLIGN